MENDKNKNKFDFKKKKDNTLRSLAEIEAFLNRFSKCKKGAALYKFFK